MSLDFKYIPLTFLNDINIIKEQIKNTVILRYLFDEYDNYSKLENLITGTQYGYNASALQSGKNKFLRISDITDGKVNWDTVPFCDCSDENTYLLNKNDLLIARTGGTTGKSFIIDNPPEKAIFSGSLIRIRANQENNPEFLNLFLNSYVYWSQVVSLNKGEFRPSVNATKLKDLIVPKIDIEIQRDAVNISKGISVNGYEALENNITKALNDFEKSQEIIEHYSYQGNNVELLKQSILQEAIQGKLTADWRKQNPNTESASELLKRIKAEKAQLIKDKKIKKEKALPPITEEEIPFELPEGWVWCRLGDINNIFLGGAAFSSSRFISESNIQVIRISNVKNDKLNTLKNPVYIDEKNASENLRNELFERDILITMTGTREKKDYCFTVELTDNHFINKRLFLNQRVGCFRLNENVDSTYTSLALKSQSLLEPVFESSTGSANQANISKSALLDIVFPLPPLEEQKAIVEKVGTLMQKFQTLEEEIKTSEANAQMLMQSVLKEAFEGKKKKFMNPKNKNQLFRLSAVLYADNNYIVSSKTTLRKIIETGLFAMERDSISIHDLIDFIFDNYNLHIDEAEISEVVSLEKQDSFLVNTIENNQVLTLTEKRKTQIQSKIDENTIEYYIDHFTKENEVSLSSIELKEL